jgi:hypothetical protein
MAKLEIPVKVYFGEIDEIIKELGQLQTYKPFEGADEKLVDVNEVMRILAGHVKVTTAEPERKTGKWQITSAYPHNVYCSVCHKKFAQTHWAVWEDGSLPRNFCPNCGAKMEGIE